MLLTITALCLPLLAHADPIWVDDPSSYKIDIYGMNTVKITVPVYNKDGYDTWIDKGKLSYQVKDANGNKGAAVKLLEWATCEEDISGSAKSVDAKFSSDAPGVKKLLFSTGSKILSQSETRASLSFNGSSKVSAEVEWSVPIELRGKSLILSWEVQRDGNMRYEENVSIDEKKIDIPAKTGIVDPMITSATISPDYEHRGQIIVPWMIAVQNDQVRKVVAYWRDAQGVTKSRDLETKASGNIYLDASEKHDSLRVVVDYEDTNDNTVDLISGRVSNYYNVPIIHKPSNLTITPVNNDSAKVILSWEVPDTAVVDLMDSDVFQIQRSISGREADFLDIATVVFDQKQVEYTFEDKTLLENAKTSDLSADGRLYPAYRLRRTVSSLWGWDDNPITARDSMKFCQLDLRTVSTAKGEWVNQDEHTLKVSWDYETGTDDHWYVWDNRAEMSLKVNMYRTDGTLVDTLVYKLTAQEIENKSKVIALPRSCVKYEIFVMVNPKDFPLKTNIEEMTIGSKEDWRKFCSATANGKRIYAKLTADIELTSSAAEWIAGNTMDKPFMGTFEGGGHTITLANALGVSPFRYASDAVIRNLTFEGPHSGPTGGFVHEGNNVLFLNCRSRMHCYTRSTGTYQGGFIYAGSRVRFTNCLFAGDYTNTGSNFKGFACEISTGLDIKNLTFTNVVYAPVQPHNSEFPFSRLSGSNEVNYRLFKTSYVLPKDSDETEYHPYYPKLPATLNEQLGVLGSQWEACEEWPHFRPVVNNSGLDGVQEFLVEMSNIYFTSSGKVVPNSLVTETRQSSVMLTWEVTNGAIDYFQVLRRVKGTTNWDIIAPNITDLGYEDTSVSPLLDYEYKVRSAVDCEGVNFEETIIREGACKHSGMLEGYVRYKDGTGVPGIRVQIKSDGGDLFYATTDDTGHYTYDTLPYLGKTSITYQIIPLGFNDGSEGIELQEGASMFEIDFNGTTNYRVVSDFVVVSSCKFSGLVMYEGTTIPVKGVHFMVNGHEVHTPSGNALETDSEGKFSFHVFKGNNKIQAVMDGHDFWDGGWFKGEEGRINGFNFKDDVPGICFYDNTTVKLIGRVAGGDKQGSMPLDNSLSHNNLGDSLVMVLTLEGDNMSRLVYDNLNPLKERTDTVFRHKSHDNGYDYQTKMVTTRRNVTIYPDPHTGEYNVKLPPVKWKVQRIYCQGYPTLFPEGKVSDVIDLTDALTLHHDTVQGHWTSYLGNDVVKPVVEYNAKYSRIYHAPVQLDYEQLGFNNYGYFGDETYYARNADGQKEEVPLVYQLKNKDGSAGKVAYTFGYPVFSIERQYPFQLSAVEKYYWNNNENSDTVDVVNLHGGKVSIHNGLVSSMHQEIIELDDNGQALVALQAEHVPYLLTKNDAIRTITMTLTMDGTTYEAKPLNAYVLNILSISGGKDVMSIDQPVLVDILRDPPGGGSKATLEKGSSLKYTYEMDLEWKLGTEIGLKEGTSTANFNGVVAAPAGAGTVAGFNNSAENAFETSFDFVVSGKGHRGFSYTMTNSHSISTSDDEKMVGAPADIYMGLQQSVVVGKASTIRAIPDRFFSQLAGKVASGDVIEIAQGKANGSLFHLVRDESYTMGTKLNSTFAHSQSHIIEIIMPQLMNRAKALMFTGTEEEAKSKANLTKQPVYLSLLKPEDDNFALMNTVDGEYVLYTSDSEARQDMHYRIILPNTYDRSHLVDSVLQYNQTLRTWAMMITQNEKEKLSATELVKNFDVDGGVGLSYEEEFESEYSYNYNINIPFFSDMYDNFFAPGGGGAGAGIPTAVVSEMGPMLAKYLGSLSALTKSDNGLGSSTEQKNEKKVEVKFVGVAFEISFKPVIEMSNEATFGKERTFSRKESFEIAMDKKSHLNFDVYRVNAIVPENSADSEQDVFTSEKFYEYVNYDNDYISRYFKTSDFKYSKGFVYRTRGGATCRPYENARYTCFYRPGEILDQRTKQIEKPVIRLDKQSVSGVPYGEPARFKVYMTNESEEPARAYPSLSLSLDDQSNPYGARLTVDGFPVTWAGTEIGVTPGQVTEKTLEVYASDGFDYDDITLSLMSCEDNTVYDEVSFDVHFLRTAGNVNISLPGDKWVMNTDAAHDKKGYSMPVVIDGFDKNQHNFDHIEFQYKESNRGEEYWTNLCSFYAKDSLFQLASGNKEMIPENGSISTKFYGEGEIIEKAYDLRAVLFCRSGNEYITSSSKVLSGIKDTRRPQLFGEPEPTNGILDIGDNVVFNFSEDIEYNYLHSLVNFEVKGEVNNDDVTNDVSIYFDKNSSVETEARRNFNDKELTVEMLIKPDNIGIDMPIFSHGTGGKKLQFWITKEKHLKAVVNDETFVSDSVVKSNDFTQVAMVLSQRVNKDSITNWYVSLYNGGALFYDHVLAEPYTGVGPLIFGRTNETNRKKSQYYQGRMMEARLWYRPLDGGLLSSIYGKKRLTGFEMGLVDYYPMNEGTGDYALDKSQGANAMLYNASWAMPQGMSLHLEWEDRGMPLDDKALTRTSEEDYTLMFWFKTDSEGRGVLVSNGAGLASNNGAKNQICIGFEAEKLMFRSNGLAVQATGNYSDNQWHHYAMTVNRAMNVGCIYVDGVLRANFATQDLGGISGGYPMLGAALYEEIRDGKPVVLDSRNWLRGNLDEICMFAQALPLSMIKNYMTKSPYGDEAGLITYLSFDRQERQKDNSLEYKPYIYSRKIHLDDDGNIVYVIDKETKQPTTQPVVDYLFNDSLVTKEMVLAHIDQSDAAPMRPYEELRNLNFSYAGRNNQIMVNINELTSKINKRNIYVTLREIPDKNGNTMASPVTATYFVDCSPLRWKENRKQETAYAGFDWDIDLAVVNYSSSTHTYTIENCPKWLKFNTYSNTVGPNSSEILKAVVSKNLNVGTYDEVIYLTDEDGMREPLYLSITVEGNEPYWTVNGNLLQHTMNIIGEVTINDELDIDSRDIVGVFDRNNVCHGVANIDYSADTGESRVYLTVYDCDNEDGKVDNKQLYFKLWRFSTGLEMLLTVNPTIKFSPSEVIGADTPVSMKAGLEYVQTFSLEPGWNWVSFNVTSENLFNLNNLLDGLPWVNGDILTDMNSNTTLIYHDNHWRLSGDVTNMGISPKRAYAVKVQDYVDFPIAGAIIKQKDSRTITVKNGWNGIGYTPMMNLSVETALSDYHSKAQEGDVIKSHDEFAVYTVTNKVGRWKGSLQYMKPGEGYLLLRKADTSASFIYPFYEPGSTFLDEGAKAPEKGVTQYLPNTMSLSAVATGIEMQPGDRLLAYADGELRGVAENSADSVFYLSVGGEGKQPLSFAIEREGEIIAATSEILLFESNAVMGTPDAPTRIDFTRRDIPQHGWYTLDGIRLQTKPTKKGVYIYNGQKRVVE